MPGFPPTNKTLEGLLHDTQVRLDLLERRIGRGAADRLSRTGEVFTDANTVTTNGWYRGESPANGPVTTGLASLFVLVGGNGNYIRQEFRRLYSDATTQDLRMWSRTSSNGGASWASWVLATATEQLGIARASYAAVFASSSTALTQFLTLAIPSAPRTTQWVINVTGQFGFNAAAAKYGLTVASSAGTFTASKLNGQTSVAAAASGWGQFAQLCFLELAPGTAATLTFSGQSSIATGDNYAFVDVIATPHWKGTN